MAVDQEARRARERARSERRRQASYTIVIRVPAEQEAIYKSAAAAAGCSLRGYILEAVRERMARDGVPLEEASGGNGSGMDR